MAPPITPLTDRFWQKVKKTATCWLWVGATTLPSKGHGGGYGRIRVGSRLRRAHRVSYELFVGPIPDGLDLDHLCGNRSCVNPDHLEPVTRRVNVRRAFGHSEVAS